MCDHLKLSGNTVTALISELEKADVEFRLVITPDHPTPISKRTHVSDPVPYLLYDNTNELERPWHYNEKDAKESKNYIANGYELIDKLFEK